MSDRELLEFAAKAAGYDCRWHPDDPFSLRSMFIAPNWQAWNPLEDDGDALRLAIELSIVLSTGENWARAQVPNEKVFEEFSHENRQDIYAATRRAIVRAAAEIGRQMQEWEEA